MRYITTGYALVLVALAGCRAPELSTDERISLPESGEMGMSDATFARPLLWGAFFQGTLLQDYADAALRSNHSSRQNMERIAMSRTALQRAKGLLLPDVNLSIRASVNCFDEYTMDDMGNSETSMPSLPEGKHTPNLCRDFSLNLSFQWEADIWSKLTRKKQAAAARWTASMEATRFAQSMLISDLAIQYYELVGLSRRKEMLRNALVSARHSHELTRQLKKEEAEAQLAVDQSYARMLSIENKLLESDQLIGEKERTIICLLDIFPSEIRRMGFDELHKLSIPLSEGIPANFLTLRPDVRSAEMELTASKADVIAAKAAFCPPLVLDVSGGFNTFNMGKWFHSLVSLIYGLAAGITAPIFRRNEVHSIWSEAKVSQRTASSQYHETALSAYTEVLDLYYASRTQTKHIRLKEKESLAHQHSVVSADGIFQLSYTSFLEILSVEERYLDSKSEHIDIVIDLYRRRILLYRALGGGC